VRHSLRCVEPQVLNPDLQPARQGSSEQPALQALSFGVQSFFIAEVRTSWQCVDGLHVGPLSTGASDAASVGVPPLEDDELLEAPVSASPAPLDDDEDDEGLAPASGAPFTGSGSEPTHAPIAVRVRVNQRSAVRRMRRF
jgi:hypothetical protein